MDQTKKKHGSYNKKAISICIVKVVPLLCSLLPLWLPTPRSTSLVHAVSYTYTEHGVTHKTYKNNNSNGNTINNNNRRSIHIGVIPDEVISTFALRETQGRHLLHLVLWKTYRQTDRHTDRLTDRHTYKHRRGHSSTVIYFFDVSRFSTFPRLFFFPGFTYFRRF